MENKEISKYLVKLGISLCPPQQWDEFEGYFREKIHPTYDFDKEDLYEIQAYISATDDKDMINHMIIKDTEVIAPKLSSSQKYLIIIRLVLLNKIITSIGKKRLEFVTAALGFDDFTLKSIESDLHEIDMDLQGVEKNIILLYELPEKYDDILMTYAIHFSSYAVSGKKHLIGLESSNYEHPLDIQALKALKKVDAFTKILTTSEVELSLRKQVIALTGSNVLVTERNFKELYFLYRQCCEILSIENIPPLYIRGGGINAFTLGDKEISIIAIDSGAIGLLTNEELMTLLGHELGHIKSGHFYYDSIGREIYEKARSGGQKAINGMLGNIPLVGDMVGSIMDITVTNTFYRWQKASEFTADRAGLLCSQNLDAALSLQIKLAGWPIKYYNRIDIPSYLEQVDLFCQMYSNDLLNQTLEFFESYTSTHPWSVLRAGFLKQWSDNGDYSDVVNKHHTPYLLHD